MSRLLLPLLAALGLGVFATSPAGAALFDDNEARRQVATERKRIDDVSAQVGAQSQQLDQIGSRLGRIEEALGKNQAVLDLFREIEGLKQEIARMRGQVEVLANGVEQAQKRQQDFYVDLDTRLRRPAPKASSSTRSARVWARSKKGSARISRCWICSARSRG